MAAEVRTREWAGMQQAAKAVSLQVAVVAAVVAAVGLAVVVKEVAVTASSAVVMAHTRV